MRSLTARVVALGLFLAACSPAAEPTTTTTSSTTTTSTTTTTTLPTTTTTFPSDLSPLTGLPLEDPELGQRRVLAVKIDNHPSALPQAGMEEADVVIEMLVEGITRFLTLWLESDSEFLGPMRSGRPTDATILAGLNNPTFARSGAQNWVQNFIAARSIHQIGEIGGDATFRLSSRSSPHNLFVNTVALRAASDARGHADDPPGRLWAFGPMPSAAGSASSVRIDFSGNIVEWEWDEEEGRWLRTAYGRESNWITRNGSTGRFAIPVLVVMTVEQYTASPPSGTSGSPVPASRTVGSGDAMVFADGKVIEGSWERADEESWFTLVDGSGQPIAVPPGRAWISLVPTQSGVTYEP